MKKIAIHSPRVSYYTGGAERYILNLTKELIKSRKKILLITYDAPKKSEWFKEFFRKYNKNIVLLKCTNLDKNFYKYKQATNPKIWDEESRIFSKEAKKFYLNSNICTIVYHYCVDCLNIPKGKKTILHLHGLPDRKRNIENKAIKKPNKIIAVSSYIAKGWKKLHNIRKRISIVHNGIVINKNVKKIAKKQDIIYFGRLIKIKGVNYLIKAIKNVIKNENNLIVKIIGEGPEKKKLEALSKKLKLEKNVLFLGKISDKKLIKEVSLSKIAVFPSYAREGIMTTILEAINEGCVVIASDSCSNREFLINNKNSIIFKPKNVKDLTQKLENLLINIRKRNKLTQQAFQDLKKMSWENQTKKISKIYWN